jgi:stage V sporulation protein SpoVS
MAEERKIEQDELKASSQTDPKALAGSIMAKFKENGYAKIRAIGPAAIGRAASACDIARSRLVLVGIDAIQHGYFWDIEIETEEEENGEMVKKTKTITGHTTVCEPR